MNLGPTWQEILVFRRRKEDEAVSRKWTSFIHLGKGYLGDPYEGYESV